jgi:hypothetical protein
MIDQIRGIAPPIVEANGQTYWQDAQSRLVPEGLVADIDKARDSLVREIVGRAKELNVAIGEFKAEAFADLGAFVDLSAEKYGVQFRGTKEGGKGTITLYTYDGKYKIRRKCADMIRFDERLQVAKQLIDECLHEWAAGTRDELQVLINDAFQVDKTGRINTGRVLGLRKLEIKDARWKQAMQAISDAVVAVGTATYLLVYERIGEGDEWRLISLDLAAV